MRSRQPCRSERGRTLRAGCVGRRDPASSRRRCDASWRRRARGPYTRHLYAADASMYARRAAARRVPARRRRRRGGGRDRRRASASRSSRAAAARASPARRRAGAGSCSTRRATCDAIGEIDVAGRARARRAGRRAGGRSTAPRRPHGLGFGPDTSTSNRATLGGMIGNNSSGQPRRSSTAPRSTTCTSSRSCSPTARARRFGALDEASGPARAGDTLEGAIHRGLREILRDHARAIAEDYPRHWRQSGGYRLDRLAPPAASTSPASSPARRARWSRSPRPTVGLVELPKRDDVRGRALRLAGRRDRRHGGRARRSARPSIEMIDRTILELSRSKLEYRRLAEHARGRSRGAAVRLLLRATPRPRRARSSTSWRRPGARTATATTRCAPRRRPSRTR